MAWREIVHPDEDAEKIFWDNVTPSRKDVCWPWKGKVNKRTGYGIMYIKGYGTTNAHRVSYSLHGGTLQKGDHVRHRCDNVACVNPDHLVSGTAKDNFTDFILRGYEHEISEGHRKSSDISVAYSKTDEYRA